MLCGDVMSLPFMKMYWGDYLGDTYHLRAIEHGGYLLLIAHYWRVGSLPSDPAKLAQIARMTKKEWAAHGDAILEFFKDGKHKRIDEEREKANAKSAKAVNAAHQRWDSEKEANLLKTLNTGNANASLLHSERNANQNQIPEPEPLRLKKENPKEKKTRSAGSAEFENFWSVYPRKINRAVALKAFEKAIRKTEADLIITAVRGYKFADDEQFIPHPATWLNQERWIDGTPTSVRPQVTEAEQAAFLEEHKRWLKEFRKQQLAD
jgi:uncharacterized protein YdaU (DUF1376 family)